MSLPRRETVGAMKVRTWTALADRATAATAEVARCKRTESAELARNQSAARRAATHRQTTGLGEKSRLTEALDSWLSILASGVVAQWGYPEARWGGRRSTVRVL